MNPLSNPNILYKILAYVSKILYPSYPCYYFPSFLLVQIYNKLVELKKNPRYRVIPLPNQFYTLLTKNQTFQCDHFCFVSNVLFDKYNFTDDPDLKLNWLNVEFGNNVNLPHSTDIVQKILSKPSSSILVPVAGVQRCQKNCIFVSENCYHNWCVKNNVRDKHPLLVQLKIFNYDQYLPRFGTRATVFLLKQPYELPFDLTDEIISNFFITPTVLYRNHTYEILLDDNVMKSSEYIANFLTLKTIRKLYFRCVHLESDENKFENFGVVMKGQTTLHQSTSINYPISRQCLDDYSFISACPWGHMKYFNHLKSCILPFMGENFYSAATTPSNSPSTSAVASTSTAASSSPPPSQPAPPQILSTRRIFPTFLLQGELGSGKRRLVEYVARSLGFQQYFINCMEIVSASNPSITETKLKLAFAKANLCEPLILTLMNFELFGIDSEGREELRTLTVFQNELHNIFTTERQYPIIVVAVANGQITKPIIHMQFLETITFEAPDKDERFSHLQWLFHKEILVQEIFNGSHETDYTDIPLWNGRSVQAAKFNLPRYLKCAKPSLDILKTIADQSQGLQFGALNMLFDNSTTNLLKRRERGELFEMDECLVLEEFEKNLHTMQSQFTDSLGAPKVPRVLWSDIGGLSKLKDEIQASIGMPLKHANLMGKNMRRSGILLYGPPGTGKTLVAKAVATECSLSFLSVQGPELLNMYVGQSEQNVREVFKRARAAAPCVIFMDELDSLAPNRGVAGDSGGVMDRVVSQLLAEMDGMQSEDDEDKMIFVLAATNRPDLIDPALLRPGRFDKLLYVGPYVTKEDKAAVFKAQMKKFYLADGLTIDQIVDQLKIEMTGADIYSICSNAWLSAVRRIVRAHEASEDSDKKELTAADVIVNLDDFRDAFEKFIPSISKKDMEYYKNLRQTYSVESRKKKI